jgi:hypothetical protein
VGQEALGGGFKHAGKIGGGWGLYSWATLGVGRVEGGKGPTCALFKRIGKVLCWGSKFSQNVGVGNGN